MFKKIHLYLINLFATNQIITELYSNIVKTDLLIKEVKIIPVKKGKIRYLLAIYKDNEINTKIIVTR